MAQVPQGDGALPEVVRMVAGVVGADFLADLDVTRETTFHDDLGLESIEFAALSERLRQSYGERVDLPAYLAGLDLEGVLTLTIGDLAGHIESRLS